MVCYAFNLLPIKENVFQAFDVKKPSKKANLIMTLVIVIISTTCSWLYKEVTAWLQLVGSLAGVMLAFSIPALSFFVAYKNKEGFKLKAKLVGCWGALVTIMGLSASVVLILIMAKVLKIED
jgi:Mn2+/Fe2+ NRAMP family transporter